MIHSPLCLFTTQHAAWPWLRQTEDGRGNMPHARFILEPEQRDPHWLAVFDEPPAVLMTHVPKERRVLFITEPPEVKPYSPLFLRQFGTVISPYPIRGVPSDNLLCENSCLPWHYAVDISCQDKVFSFTTLQDFRDMPVPIKTKQLSVICSTKAFTEVQKKRMAFVEKLQVRLGAQVDVFGRGRKPIDNKAEVIAPYRYHLVLENNYIDNFWTEKLSDAWLGYAFPLYLGAPNAPACFPEGGMLPLRPDADSDNLDSIVRLLDADPWEARLSVLRQCREQVLTMNNVFVRLDRLMHEADAHVRNCPPLKRAEAIRGTGRWCTVLLRRAMHYGLYNPFSS